MKYSNQELDSIHDACGWHEDSIKNSSQCGCFYCITLFSPSKIVECVDESEDCPRGSGKTVICPNFGIDAVIPDSLNYKLTEELLREMNKRFF